MKIVECKVNHLKEALGYHMKHTVFSWKVENAQGVKQKMARICISLTPDMNAICFDTGESETSDSLGTTIGMKLRPRTRYYWTVWVRTDVGEEAISEVQWFETAKMEEPWEAKWISCDRGEKRHPIVFRDIAITKKIRCARLYICGLGLYEAYLGEKRISQEYLTPYCNDYNEWLQYQTYDVTELLEQESQLSVLLGNGWYGGRLNYYSTPDSPACYEDAWKLIAELRIEYEDGSEEVIGTDNSWKVRRSSIYFSNIYDGEKEDTTFPELPLENAIIIEAPEAKLMERLSTPVTIHEKLPVQEVIHTPAGETVLDLGQNMTGTFQLRVKIPKGQKVYLQFGEILQNGNFYRENLRTALAEYTWISDGKETVLQPHFTFYGYRYVKVAGIPKIHREDFTGLCLYSDIPDTGHMITGHAMVNQLISNVRWGQKDNYLDVPTDCPQRDERLGWTGDAQVFMATACFQSDCYAFMRKYLYDMEVEQKISDGMVPNVIPIAGTDDGCACVWGDATCIIPWTLYEFYGDASILEEHYDSMKAWVEYIRGIDGENHGWRRHFHFGDWLALDHPNPAGGTQTAGGTDEGFIADVYYLYSTRILRKTAKLLEQDDDAWEYAALEEQILYGILQEYFSPEGRCCIDTQTAHLLNLRFGLSNQEKAKEALLAKLRYADGKLQTGFVGTPFLCNVLSEIGESKKAYRLLLNEEYPGWLYEVKLGATTVWERWNSVMEDGSVSSTGMNSLNHYAYGSILEWMWRHAAGIAPDVKCPGFRKAHITPKLSEKLGFLDAVLPTAAGTYESHWKFLGKDEVELQFVIPFGCTAEITLPYAPPYLYEQKENRLFAQVKNGICIVKAGTYQVRYTLSESLTQLYTVESPMQEIMADPDARFVVERLFPRAAELMHRENGQSLKESARNFPDVFTAEAMDRLNKEFNALM